MSLKQVYQAENAIDAQLLCDILIEAGFEASVFGGFLTGASGEIPPDGLIQVMVRFADDDTTGCDAISPSADADDSAVGEGGVVDGDGAVVDAQDGAVGVGVEGVVVAFDGEGGDPAGVVDRCDRSGVVDGGAGGWGDGDGVVAGGLGVVAVDVEVEGGLVDGGPWGEGAGVSFE